MARTCYKTVLSRLAMFPAVVLLGPRQVGKTTLAEAIAADGDSVYLDLENPRDRGKLADPNRYLAANEGRLSRQFPWGKRRAQRGAARAFGIADREALFGHPILGASWEGFVIDNIASVMQEGTLMSFIELRRGRNSI